MTFENEGDRDFYVKRIGRPIAHPRAARAPASICRCSSQSPARRTHGVVTILHAGRLLRSKGVMDLVAAAKILKERFGKAVRILIAGPHTDGDPDGLDDAERRLLETSPDVEFLGARSPVEMPALMASADIFVLPTRYPEGLPRVLLEAGATGAALVAGDVDGTRAFIENGVNGLLLESTQAEALAEALSRLISDPLLRDRYGEAARAETRSWQLRHSQGGGTIPAPL